MQCKTAEKTGAVQRKSVQSAAGSRSNRPLLSVAGNMAIQRYAVGLQRQSVGQATGPQQQQQGPTQQQGVTPQQLPSLNTLSGPESPGLGFTMTHAVETLIRVHQYQSAVNSVVSILVSEGKINLNLLAGQKITYDPNLTSDDGSTSMPNWDYTNNKADPPTVRVGPSAFSSVPYLYSVMMHEYQHVLYQQTLAHQQIDKQAHAQGFESPSEVEASAWELIHGAESGISKTPADVASIWSTLNTAFWNMASNDQATERALVTQAHQKAQSFVQGTGTQLVPFQHP